MRVEVQISPSFESWRGKARELLLAEVRPEEVNWVVEGNASLFSSLATSIPRATQTMQKVSSQFLISAERVACARNADRWHLLYRILYRLTHGEPHLLRVETDIDMRQFRVLERAVKWDVHKTHAFVRFKEVNREGELSYMAWHRPVHHTLKLSAPFFQRRFGDRPWIIFTPEESAIWDLQELRFGEGMPQSQFHAEDAFDSLWQDYYRSIFNPARIKWKAMTKEMPERFWPTLPEARVIQELVRSAPHRIQEMAKRPIYLAEVPKVEGLADLKREALKCQACPLHEKATQVVFGAGASSADLMIVGEQPGDEEDQLGAPFSGPAGEVLSIALEEAGISRERVYLTNAVKHFKWTPSDRPEKPRLHKTASGGEVHACRPWLEAEVRAVQPKVILALGRTAGLSLLGRLPKLSEERGSEPSRGIENIPTFLSWHPAAILREMDPSVKNQKFSELVSDLKKAWERALS